MMRILLSMSEELNINNVLNANFGLKEMMVAAQWHVNVDKNFVMIVEELVAHMDHALIQGESYQFLQL